MHVFNVARPRQRNISQITSPTTCNLHAYRQAGELRLNSFFISTTLLSFEHLIRLDYFIWRRVGWWRDGFSVTSWLVAKLPCGEMTGYRDKGSRQLKHVHVHTRYTSTYPLPENRKDENRKMSKLKDVKIAAAEISLINSVPVRIKFSRVLTLSKTCRSSDVGNCEGAKTQV